MRVVFMGSAEIACASLQMLLDASDIFVAGMVTQPDRAAGRRRKPAACAAKAYAMGLGIELYTPENVNSPEAIERIQSWQPDIGIVIAYGQILKKELLGFPPLGFINIHTSLLPKYRGAAPIQWAIANGEVETGVPIMQMDTGMDTGDILAQCVVAIGETDTAGDVHDRMAVVGADLLRTVLPAIEAGRAVRRPQEHPEATLAPKLTKLHGKIDWTQSARNLYNCVRGFFPWPCCTCQYTCNGHLQTMRVLEARVECGSGSVVAPGIVIDVNDGPLVACSEGALRLLRVQPEGGKAMAGDAFLCGRPIQVGDRFE